MPTDPMFLRQLAFVDQEALAEQEFTVIGAGGIGSPTVLELAKMGAKNITVIDHDFVSEHNRPSTLYRARDVDRPKVEALREIVLDLADVEITIMNQKWEPGMPLFGIVIAAVDDIDVRRAIWEDVKSSIDIPYFIDARMGGLVYQVFTVSPRFSGHRHNYELHLFHADNAAQDACTAKAIVFNTFAIAAVICNQVRLIINNDPEMPNKVQGDWMYRQKPYKWEQVHF